MPIYRIISVYEDTDTRLRWSITTTREAADADAAEATFHPWNVAYMAICSNRTRAVATRISDVNVYRDIRIYDEQFEDPGALNPPCTEVSSYLLVKGLGSSTTQSTSNWKLHGLSESVVSGSKYTGAGALLTALKAASLVYFRQYRPVAGTRVPVVPTPIAFADFYISVNMYTRRLGRPLTFAGQQRAYLRT